MEASYLLVAIGVGIASGAVMATAYSYIIKAKWGNIERERESSIKEAERTAASMIKEAKIESKDIVYQAKLDVEKDFKERRNELNHNK